MSKIVVSAYPVKYLQADVCDGYVLVRQNRTTRRVYDGYHFDDDGVYIWISYPIASCFQHKQKVRKYEVDTETKEWTRYDETTVSRHVPEAVEAETDNEINELRK